MTIEHKSVASSNIASVGYDPESETLEIKFNGSGIYSYEKVPASVYDALMAAESKGSYFAKNIKGKYGFKKGLGK